MSKFIVGLMFLVLSGPVFAGEIKDPAIKTVVENMVRNAGYTCPKLKILWDKGMAPRGALYKVFCGPRNRRGVFPRLVYRFVVVDKNHAIVRPWSD